MGWDWIMRPCPRYFNLILFVSRAEDGNDAVIGPDLLVALAGYRTTIPDWA